MKLHKEKVHMMNKSVEVPAVDIDGDIICFSGKLIKYARSKDEWYSPEIQNPYNIINLIKANRFPADIFTFWQKIPNITPKYNFYYEFDDIAVLRITDYDYWFNKQIKKNAREAIRKSFRRGVVTKIVPYTDELISGIQNIYNETPIRQGKRFWHYGADFNYTKQANGTYLENSIFIGAFFEEQLIGYIKLVNEMINNQKYTTMMQIVSLNKHRDKAPTNALLARTVEYCSTEKIPFLPYGYWGDGSLNKFKLNNGFEKISLPRYFVPITIKGDIIIKLKLHNGIKKMVPDPIISVLKTFRKKINS